jgi:hypothetical protein
MKVAFVARSLAIIYFIKVKFLFLRNNLKPRVFTNLHSNDPMQIIIIDIIIIINV